MQETLRETEARAEAIGRCRAAYKLNGIEWDGVIARLPVKKLHALAAHWEERYRTRPIENDSEDGPVTLESTIYECKKLLNRVTGNSALNRPARQGQRRFAASQLQYHGSKR